MKFRHLPSVMGRLFIGATVWLSPQVEAETRALLVQGLAGEAWYQRQFSDQTETIGTALASVVGEARLTVLRGTDARREAIMDWFDNAAVNLNETDSALLILIGHGSFDGVDYKFNVSGPDVNLNDLKQAFAKINTQNKVFVNTSSSSGALLEMLNEEGITLLTATKNGRERNATRFGRFFAHALGEFSADSDKNQKISLQEAFNYAERATSDFYEGEGLLATEHAQLQESGDAQLVGRMTLANLASEETVVRSPELLALFEQRDTLDAEIESLRLRRIGMSDQDYEYVFQSLMLELITIQDEIEELERAG